MGPTAAPPAATNSVVVEASADASARSASPAAACTRRACAEACRLAEPISIPVAETSAGKGALVEQPDGRRCRRTFRNEGRQPPRASGRLRFVPWVLRLIHRQQGQTPSLNIHRCASARVNLNVFRRQQARSPYLVRADARLFALEASLVAPSWTRPRSGIGSDGRARSERHASSGRRPSSPIVSRATAERMSQHQVIAALNAAAHARRHVGCRFRHPPRRHPQALGHQSGSAGANGGGLLDHGS